MALFQLNDMLSLFPWNIAYPILNTEALLLDCNRKQGFDINMYNEIKIKLLKPLNQIVIPLTIYQKV